MSTTMNLFEYAARNKLRFATPKGDLTTEQLFDVPLRSRDDYNLDAIAKTMNRSLKALTEESFVETTRTPAQTRTEVGLDIVKFVIASKLEDEARAAKRAENKLKKEQLLRALAEKQEGKLSSMSERELQRQIDALDD